MTGFHYKQTYGGGVSLQVSDALEHEDRDNRSLLLPGLYFTVVFTGCVAFSFAQNRYRLESGDVPLCYVIINNGNEFITHHRLAGRATKTVTVSVPREWLEARSKTLDDKQCIQRMLQRTQVLSWQTKDPVAEEVLLSVRADSFTQRLLTEQKTLQLLVINLMQLEAQYDRQLTEGLQVDAMRQSLMTRVDELLESGHSLRDIADKLKISERTLQRRFKTLYRQTLASYVKRKRLEQAKKTLLTERLSVSETACLAGYNHSSNFVSAFKHEYGITPTEFIARHRYQLKS